jgi:hypothetical protein
MCRSDQYYKARDNTIKNHLIQQGSSFPDTGQIIVSTTDVQNAVSFRLALPSSVMVNLYVNNIIIEV